MDDYHERVAFEEKPLTKGEWTIGGIIVTVSVAGTFFMFYGIYKFFWG